MACGKLREEREDVLRINNRELSWKVIVATVRTLPSSYILLKFDLYTSTNLLYFIHYEQLLTSQECVCERKQCLKSQTKLSKLEK